MAFQKWELIADVQERKMDWKENTIIRERAKALPYLDIMEGEERSERLDMDHIHIRFLDFLWGFVFIGPFSMLLWKKGTFVMQFRIWLINLGILKLKQCDDMEALVGKMCLEFSQVINYFAKTKSDSELGNIAGFFFTNFPYVDNDLNFQIADLFAVDINLDTKRLVKAKLDNTDLTASQACILLWFNNIAAQHVKLHAMANWGVNGHMSLDDVNPFLRRNSVVTVIYNYFGYSTFSRFLKGWEEQGLLSEGWSRKENPLIQCFNQGIKDGIGQHGNIVDLIPYSRFVKFIVKVRMIFMDEFAKHKNQFPGIDGEVCKI